MHRGRAGWRGRALGSAGKANERGRLAQTLRANDGRVGLRSGWTSPPSAAFVPYVQHCHSCLQSQRSLVLCNLAGSSLRGAPGLPQVRPAPARLQCGVSGGSGEQVAHSLSVSLVHSSSARLSRRTALLRRLLGCAAAPMGAHPMASMGTAPHWRTAGGGTPRAEPCSTMPRRSMWAQRVQCCWQCCGLQLTLCWPLPDTHAC